MTITGTHFNYYFICKRKLWLFAHNIQMEMENENVQIGKVISENTYGREKHEVGIYDELEKIGRNLFYLGIFEITFGIIKTYGILTE